MTAPLPGLNSPTPEFIDNRQGNTLESALRARLEHLAATLVQPVDVDIVTGYFNAEGFGRIAASLSRAGRVRLLLGAEPVPPPAQPDRRLGDPRGERFQIKLLKEALARTERGLLHDRDRLLFAPTTDAAIEQLLDFLRSGRIEVRRYTRRFLHGKAYIFRSQGVLAGSSNFTAAGLAHNYELNLGQYQPSVASRVEQWFDELWADAEPYDLASIYAARFREYPPYLIYLRVLLERYGPELEEERPAGGTIPLTRFQSDGIDRAGRILERYNGVIIADSVGLGKSFLGGEIIRRVVEERRQRALLVAPATLRDGTWARFTHRFMLPIEVVSYQQLVQDVQLGGNHAVLQSKLAEYSLIVVDEAHTLRNPDTTYAVAMRRLLQGKVPKQLVLMTATPVNNSLWDLYALLQYFVRHDAVFAEAGIRSLKERFALAAKTDPFSLKPDVLWDILDATTVRRTRHFVKKWYPNDTVKGPDGVEVTIRFPKPLLAQSAYDLEAVLPGFFARVEQVLAPADDADPELSLARYFPSKYRRDGAIEERELALVGLLRSGLLKRFESSAYAFAQTLDKMVQAHVRFLQGLDRGRLLSTGALATLAEDDADDVWDDVLAEADELDARQFDITMLKAAVRKDRAILEELRDRARTVTPARDPKLQLLADDLSAILGRAREGATNETDERNRRKVIVFSYFADTARWIFEWLVDRTATDRRLAAYRGRVVLVSGDEDGRKTAVYGFAPQSSEAPAGYEADKYDILVTTDVLSEGVNLQQAANILNYDLPWNPMRLVQRHGRIDRIGSPHRDVHIVCVFPDAQLDGMLALENRIRRKLAQAVATVGLDSEILPGVDAVDRNFADDVEEIRRLRAGDAGIFENAGEAAYGHSGEEYRQELRKALQERQAELDALPWGAGSGLARGDRPGHFFCARLGDHVVLRFVPANPELPIERDALTCLRMITCELDTRRVLSDDMRAAAYTAWEKARADIVAEWNRAADPANLSPSVRPLFRIAASHVRDFPVPGMTREEHVRLIECLEAPRDFRDERALRSVFTPEGVDGERTTAAIAALVAERGYQPFRAPEPLPEAEGTDVQLVVWMAVAADTGGGP
ncbi:MAG: helicase-related protein [Gemmatimonadota bacterium]|nr:phospholipase D-like domain-containing protein [Gemmatimonadota bacterium]